MAETICLHGLKVKSLTVDKYFFTYTDGKVLKNVQKAFGYLNELFSCPLPIIFINTKYILKSKKPFFFGLKQCNELVVEGNDKIRRRYLRSILDELVIRKQLFLDIPIRKSFKFNIATCKHPEQIFVACCAHWVTSEMAFKLNCSHLILNDVKWTAKDCETFVALWLNSYDTFFSFSELHWKKRVPADLNFENLGVELREFDPETRDPAYRYSVNYAVDVSTGRDIIRKDGLMATVAVSSRYFVFCVWHERRQDMDGVKTHGLN